MWKLFSQIENDPAVYLKVETIEDKSPGQLTYKITATNYIKMWCRVYDNEGIIEMMLNSNKGTETEDKQSFLDAGLQMLHDPKMLNEKVFTETQGGNLSVRLLCKTPIVLRMNFILKLCPPEQFFRSITLPLLEVINDLQSSQKKLRQHLIQKDEEIKGFKDMLPEGSPLMRCLRTETYNDLKHMKTHSAVDKLFGTDPVEVYPGHIIQYGRALPMVPDESDVENTLCDTKPSRLTTNQEINIVIKKEPNESSENLTLQLQIPAVKSESIETIDKLNSVVKSEPNDEMNSAIDVKNEPEISYVYSKTKDELGSNNVTNESKVTTQGSGDNDLSNGIVGQSNASDNGEESMDNTKINNVKQIDTSGTHTQLPREITEDSQLPTIKDTELKSEQNASMKRLTHSPKSITEPKASTPKKRRKNLNY